MPNSIDRTTLALSRLNKALAIACLALVMAIAVRSTAGAQDSNGGIRLVTQNMYVGSSFEPLTTQPNLALAVTTIYNNIVATKPAERAAAMAREIARRPPDLIALQEAMILRTGPLGLLPATTIQSDFVQSLLDELAGLGLRYRAVAILPGLDAQAPSTLGFNVRISNQNAILVRSAGDIAVSNLQIEQFGIKFVTPTAAGPIADPRGWASIDVTVRGNKFRFVTTHLNSIVP